MNLFLTWAKHTSLQMDSITTKFCLTSLRGWDLVRLSMFVGISLNLDNGILIGPFDSNAAKYSFYLSRVTIGMGYCCWLMLPFKISNLNILSQIGSVRPLGRALGRWGSTTGVLTWKKQQRWSSAVKILLLRWSMEYGSHYLQSSR